MTPLKLEHDQYIGWTSLIGQCLPITNRSLSGYTFFIMKQCWFIWMLSPAYKSSTVVVQPLNALTEHIHINTPNSNSFRSCSVGRSVAPPPTDNCSCGPKHCWRVSGKSQWAAPPPGYQKRDMYIHWITANISIFNMSFFTLHRYRHWLLNLSNVSWALIQMWNK